MKSLPDVFDTAEYPREKLKKFSDVIDKMKKDASEGWLENYHEYTKKIFSVMVIRHVNIYCPHYVLRMIYDYPRYFHEDIRLEDVAIFKIWQILKNET